MTAFCTSDSVALSRILKNRLSSPKQAHVGFSLVMSWMTYKTEKVTTHAAARRNSPLRIAGIANHDPAIAHSNTGTATATTGLVARGTTVHVDSDSAKCGRLISFMTPARPMMMIATHPRAIAMADARVQIVRSAVKTTCSRFRHSFTHRTSAPTRQGMAPLLHRYSAAMLEHRTLPNTSS